MSSALQPLTRLLGLAWLGVRRTDQAIFSTGAIQFLSFLI